jgi:hypothetical protein|nr:MAG TPA: coat polyprotein [Caudoviricetes sp.]
MNNEQYEEFMKLAQEQKQIAKDLAQTAEELDSYMSYYRATGVGKGFAGMFYSDAEKSRLSTLGSYFSEEIDKLHQAIKEMNDAYLKIRLDIPELHQSELKSLRAKALTLQKEIASQEALLKLDARKRNSQVTFSVMFFVWLGVIGWYLGSVIMCLIVASLFLLYGSWVASLIFSPALQQQHKELEANKAELQDNAARQAELSLEMY